MMIKVENISYHTRNKKILQDISFSAEKGELLTILGSNGAGKSTLLKCVGGELKPSSGNIFLQQKPLQQWRREEMAKCRGILSQQYQITMPFLVREIVMMGRYPHFKTKAAPKDYTIVEESLQYAGVSALADRNYLTLSGGEQQRVQIARVLAQLWTEIADDKLLLLDEPVSALDILYQHTILKLVKKLTHSGFTVIAVLHDLNLALQYADKVLLMKDGGVIAKGDLGQLTAQNIKTVYGVDADILSHPTKNSSFIFVS